MRLFLTTALKDLSDKELSARVQIPANFACEENDALRELLIRSVNQNGMKSRIFGSVCNSETAIKICKAHLAKNPQHNFFNLIMGFHCVDKVEKQKYLETAAYSVGPRPAEVSGAAAFELAVMYKKDGKYIEAHAWLVKAMLSRYSQAQAQFLGQRDDVSLPPFSGLDAGQIERDHSSTLSFCTFIATILADSDFEFPLFTETKWYAYWHNDNKPSIEDAHKVRRKEALNDILTTVRMAQKFAEQKRVSLLLHYALSANPAIYHDFFAYCLKAKIIPENVYHAVMCYYIKMMPDNIDLKTSHLDKGAYTLAKYFLQRRANNPVSKAEGFEFLAHLSEKFNGYDVNDFVDTKADNDEVLYRIFKILLTKGQYGVAQQFLEKINKDKPGVAMIYDKDIFKFFAFVDMNERNVEIFHLKQKIFRQIVSAENLAVDEDVLTAVLEQSAKINNDFYELRMNFFAVIAMLRKIHAEIKVANAKSADEFDRVISGLENSEELHTNKTLTFAEWRKLKDRFVNARIGYGKEEQFGAVKNLLDKISKQIIRLEEQHEVLQHIEISLPPRPSVQPIAYQPMYPQLQQHQYASEDEQMKWAMAASVQAQRVPAQQEQFRLNPATQPSVRSDVNREDEEIRLAMELSRQEATQTVPAAAVYSQYQTPSLYPAYQPLESYHQPIALPRMQYNQPNPPPYDSALNAAQYQSVAPSAPALKKEELLIDLSDPSPVQVAPKQENYAEELFSSLMPAASSSQFTLYGPRRFGEPVPPQYQADVTIPKPPGT